MPCGTTGPRSRHCLRSSGRLGRDSRPTALITTLGRHTRWPSGPLQMTSHVEVSSSQLRDSDLGIEDDVIAHAELVGDPVEVALVLVPDAERVGEAEVHAEDVRVGTAR